MPLNETSGNLTTDAFGGGVAVVPNYIEDVFSTYLYTGNGTSQTITNNIDLSTKGGLVWLKYRSGAASTTYHHVYDSARGKSGNASYNYLYTNDTSPQGTGAYGPTSFNTNGFSLNDYANESTIPYASWTFRKQPKFFDVVTYTGNYPSTQSISHSLGSTPGMIICKAVGASENWRVYHTSLGVNKMLTLNTTGSETDITGYGWSVSSTAFSPSGYVNSSGVTYVAYLFASNAGGFGLTGTDNVISCGSFTTDGSGNATVSLGYEPQWVMVKRSDGADDWYITDSMRGFTVQGSNSARLRANSSAAETLGQQTFPSSTGFTFTWTPSATYIYIAIRRGPMKVPTVGTSVYKGISRSGTGATATISGVGFAPDLAIGKDSGVGGASVVSDKLRGAQYELLAQATDAETFYSNDYLSFTNDGAEIGSGSGGWLNGSGRTNINWFFRRAPSFFDEVCYTGTGSALTVSHNLAVAPELIIHKRRAGGTDNWQVLSNINATNYTRTILNGTSGGSVEAYDPTTFFTVLLYPPTASSYVVSQYYASSGSTYVDYLFATCAGVSKVGSYTGNGTTQTINCGFTGGARFVLIKRTDSTGDWYTYDTARGMTTLTDPYLLLNSTAGEVATLGSVTTVSTGFALNSAILAAINVSSATYIFLAIS